MLQYVLGQQFPLQSFLCLPYLDTQKPEKVTEELINLLSPKCVVKQSAWLWPAKKMLRSTLLPCCHDTKAYKHWGMCRKEEGRCTARPEEKLTYKTQTL